MNGYKYWMDGTFTLQDEHKKKEMNGLILKVLDKIGIRKLGTMRIAGEDLLVTTLLKPDEHGNVEFNYSIIDNSKVEGNQYNINTCELTMREQGDNHFGLAMCFIMTILESYSETPYFFMSGNDLCSLSSCASLIKVLTGVTLSFHNREKIFDAWVHIRSRNKDSKISIYHVMELCPRKYSSIDDKDFPLILLDTEFNESELKGLKKDSMFYVIEDFVLSAVDIMRNNPELKDRYREYIAYLLDLDLEQRKEEALKESELAFLAKGSCKVLAPFLVRAYADAYGLDIINVWLDINKKGYRDIDFPFRKLSKNKEKKDTDRQECNECKNEDEFLELETADFIISDLKKGTVRKWIHEYHAYSSEDYKNIEVEKTLVQVLHDMNEIWENPIKEQLIEEILEHKEDDRYKRIVYQMKCMIDQEISYFSELTDTYVKKYILRRISDNSMRMYYLSYMELLSNFKYRNELFGF